MLDAPLCMQEAFATACTLPKSPRSCKAPDGGESVPAATLRRRTAAAESTSGYIGAAYFYQESLVAVALAATHYFPRLTDQMPPLVAAHAGSLWRMRQ
jgi:hypothetical protein